MSDLDRLRRYFAEEIEAVANLSNKALIDALAAVPRESFLGAGPWTVRSELDFMAPPRQTPDADPRRTYHNYAIAIDPARQLFNGAPSLLASTIDRLALREGSRVLHVGTATGYYTALIARTVGPSGRVVGIEVDRALADTARKNLERLPWVEIRNEDASGPCNETFDGILINAGVTHPRASWLDALGPDGRIVLPITASFPGLGPIGKGVQVLLHKADDGSFRAGVVGFVAIYSAVGLRDDDVNGLVHAALQRAPFPRLARLRRDTHEADAGCWLHGTGWCLSTS
jgi:protein-L-isoaspartate(D-aspartate) O-methyltransferase